MGSHGYLWLDCVYLAAVVPAQAFLETSHFLPGFPSPQRSLPSWGSWVMSPMYGAQFMEGSGSPPWLFISITWNLFFLNPLHARVVSHINGTVTSGVGLRHWDCF